MNKENLLKLASIVEKMPHFDMIYPQHNFLNALDIGFEKVSKDSYGNAGIILGLRHQQVQELFFAVSYGSTGMDTITTAQSLVPAALRYMVEEEDINWRRAMTAVMMDNALERNKL